MVRETREQLHDQRDFWKAEETTTKRKLKKEKAWSQELLDDLAEARERTANAEKRMDDMRARFLAEKRSKEKEQAKVAEMEKQMQTVQEMLQTEKTRRAEDRQLLLEVFGKLGAKDGANSP